MKTKLTKGQKKRLLNMKCPLFSRPRLSRGRVICRSILSGEERRYIERLEKR